MNEEYEIYLLDQSGALVAQLPFGELRLTLCYNAPGCGQVSLATSSLPIGLTPDGLANTYYRAFVRRNGNVLMSGVLVEVRREWSSERDELSLIIKDDLSLLAERLIVPVPSGPPYSTASHHVISGPVEDVIYNYLAYHAGDLAREERRIPGLIQAPSLGRGPTVTVRARFIPLLDMLQRLADIGGLGFRMQNLYFEIYAPTASSVVYSDQAGTLISFARTVRRPSGVYCYVCGAGEGEYRIVVERAGDIARWGRIECWYDQRNLADAGELAISGDAYLSAAARAAETIQWEAEASLDEIGLGQIVNIEFGGRMYADVVRQIDVRTDGAAESIRISSGGAGDAPQIYQRVSALEDSIQLLEAV